MPLAPVVQTLDSAIHRINYYPADKYLGKPILRYSLDGNLPSAWISIHFKQLAPV